MDYAINDKHTLVARYSFFHNDNLNQGVSQYALPERAFDSTFSNHTLQLTETAVVNKSTVNETRFQFIRTRFANDPLNTGVSAVNVFDAFSSGSAPVGNSFNENTRWEVTNTTTQAHGAHSVKFGARLRGVRLSDFSENNFNGTYTFSSLDQYRRAVAGETVGGVRVGPTQFTLTTGEPLSEISQVDFGGFVQDDWKLRPNLTLGGGVRYERQTNLGSAFNFAPRVYLAWSPDGGGAADRPRRSSASAAASSTTASTRTSRSRTSGSAARGCNSSSSSATPRCWRRRSSAPTGAS